MTKNLYFDTDCMSAFLWVNGEDILTRLFPGKVILPIQVYHELCHPSVPHFKGKINKLLAHHLIFVQEIVTGTQEYQLYYQLAFSPPKGEPVLGKGEAAVIALAKKHNGIIASSNFTDVGKFARKFGLDLIGTADILVVAFQQGLIDEAAGNSIWSAMVARKRRMPGTSFTEYLHTVGISD